MVVAFRHNEIFGDDEVTARVATQWNSGPIGALCSWYKVTRRVIQSSRCADKEQRCLCIGCFEEPAIVPASITAHIVFGWRV